MSGILNEQCKMRTEDWIKVEDRLPERMEGLYVTHNVLVSQGIKGYSIAFYSYKEGHNCWYNTMGWKLKGVTHWMPIVPPKED